MVNHARPWKSTQCAPNAPIKLPTLEYCLSARAGLAESAGGIGPMLTASFQDRWDLFGSRMSGARIVGIHHGPRRGTW